LELKAQHDIFFHSFNIFQVNQERIFLCFHQNFSRLQKPVPASSAVWVQVSGSGVTPYVRALLHTARPLPVTARTVTVPASSTGPEHIRAEVHYLITNYLKKNSFFSSPLQ
jgi:hypothetical protein